MQEALHLLDIPRDILEKIATFLDFIDLKLLSQTCKCMNEISWTSLGRISNIYLNNILNHADLQTFKNSKRIYENFKFRHDISRDDKIWQQLNSIPSFQMKNIYFDLHVISKLPDIIKVSKHILQKYKVKHFQFSISVREDLMEFLENIYSNFPKSQTTFEICVANISKIDYDELNRILKPNKVSFPVNCENIEINKDIYNVKSLKTSNNHRGLEYFKELEKLIINFKFDLRNFQTLILNNKRSLKELEIDLNIPFKEFKDWDFEIPCQLKSFKSSQKFETKLLAKQRNLRHIFFFENENISSEILHILSKNMFLSTIYFKYCFLKSGNFEDFKFLKNVSEMSFVKNFEDDLTFLNNIFYNIEKVHLLHFDIDRISNKTQILNTNKKLLENLKILKLQGFYISKYISSRIICPNLEVCNIEFLPDFIFNCKRLRNLRIEVKIGFTEIVNILENVKSLETFHFNVHSESLLKSLKYIFGNLGNIQHFKIETEIGDEIDENIMNTVDEMLTTFNFKWERTDLMYFTENFSFELWVYD